MLIIQNGGLTLGKEPTNPLSANGWEITSFWPMDWVAHKKLYVCWWQSRLANDFHTQLLFEGNDLDTIDTFALCDLLPIVVPQHINFFWKKMWENEGFFEHNNWWFLPIPSSNRGHWVPWQDGIANAVGLLQLVEISDVFLDGLRSGWLVWLGAAGYVFFSPRGFGCTFLF